ncbi:MAG: 1-acyl-sn-glycerol-3-phosphate acyltransferase [Pseudomonadales bacterium]|nr:1-acyl-sn-glycerol-3-phosphate acyltransferase [Pseudomonadales bacterium]
MAQRSDFDDIRPYHDDEVATVLQRVLCDDEFAAAMARFRFPQFARFCPWLIKPLLRFFLKRRLAKVASVAAFQDVIEGYMSHMIATTTDGLSSSGLDKLQRDKAYLFLSNHRDIAMDPAFVNFVLYHQKMQTVRIAIGDNLLTKPFASDLMRLNKSFLVRRGDMPPRKLFAA